MKKIVLLVLLFLVGINSWANHISGLDVTYECMGGNSYFVKVNFFRACSSVAKNAPLDIRVNFRSSCGMEFAERLVQISGKEISQLCPGEMSNSSCNGGTYPGLEQYVYGGLVTLASNCNWGLELEVCCRSSATNINMRINHPEVLGVKSMLNKYTACNSSPVFNPEPNLYLCVNEDISYNFSVTEPDGDSLVYSFTDPVISFKNNGDPKELIVFKNRYNAKEPIPGIVLDSSTGNLKFRPTTLGNFLLAIRVDEYDHATGKFKGFVVRDIQFEIISCNNNEPPVATPGFSSLTGAGVAKGNDVLFFCDGGDFSFDIEFTDPDMSDLVTLESNIADVFPGATYVTKLGNPAIITISGTVTSTTPSVNMFVVDAKDDACPIYSSSSFSYKILRLEEEIKANVIFETQEICDDGYDGHVSISGVDGVEPYTYLWDANASNQTTSRVGPLLSDNDYGVTIKDSRGCILDTTITMPLPIKIMDVSTQATDVFCANSNTGSIECRASEGTAPYTYLWPSVIANNTKPIVSNLSAGDYEVVITDANGCEDRVVSTVFELSKLEVSELTHQSLKCFGDNDGSASVSVTGGSTPYQYSWPALANNQTSDVVSNLVEGTYIMTVTDANLCEDTAKIVITQPSKVELQGLKDTVICESVDFTLSVNAIGGNGGYVYTWDNGLPNLRTQTINLKNSTSYMVNVVDAMGCKCVDLMNVKVNKLYQDSLKLWKDKDVCSGKEANLFASYNGHFGPYTYEWNNGLGTGEGPIIVVPNQTETYDLTFTDKCNNQLTDQITVNVLESPRSMIPSKISEGCEPLNVGFKDQVVGLDTYTYNWDFGDGLTSSDESPTHEYENEGTYVVSVVKTSINGCVGDPVQGNVLVYPSVQAYGVANKLITNITNPTIDFTNLSTGVDTVRWDFSAIDFAKSETASYTYPDVGVYPVLLSVSNKYGCHDDYTFNVEIVNGGDLVVPDAFIPNPNESNGGVYDAISLSNEVFYPRMDYVEEFHMVIYNRWGELIFETSDINIGWDGYYQEKLSPQDMYIWKVNAVFENGHEISEAGSLTLLK